MQPDSKTVTIFGTSWCGHSRNVRNYLDHKKIKYKWVDIEQDDDAAAFVESVNDGYRSVPTLSFPDGSVLVEPTVSELEEKFGKTR